MVKKKKTSKPSEMPAPEKHPETKPHKDPREPAIPEEDPDNIPNEDPFNTPPYEIPVPRKTL